MSKFREGAGIVYKVFFLFYFTFMIQAWLLGWTPNYFFFNLSIIYIVKFCTDLKWQIYKFWQMYTQTYFYFTTLEDSLLFPFPVNTPSPTRVLFLSSKLSFACSRISCIWNHTLRTCVWLLSSNMMFLRFIQVVACRSGTQDVSHSLMVLRQGQLFHPLASTPNTL